MRADFYLLRRCDATCDAPILSRRHRYDAGLDRRISHMFIHTVYFWLRPGTSEEAKAQLVRDCREYLGKVPSVKQLMVGVPAMTPREVVDNSYGVGLTVVLEDSKGHDIYQEHSLHKDFIARNKAYWERVQIYDYVG